MTFLKKLIRNSNKNLISDTNNKKIKKKISYKNFIYNKFLGILIKKGKKSTAKKILDTVLKNVSKKTKKSINLILYKIISNLTTKIEIKRVKFRGGSHLIPFSISRSRQIYLALKWILLSIKIDKRKKSVTEKLSIEIFRIINKMPSEALNAKTFNNSQAYLNRSNAHFRW
jgi:small subunit ribosomal protein S7